MTKGHLTEFIGWKLQILPRSGDRGMWCGPNRAAWQAHTGQSLGCITAESTQWPITKGGAPALRTKINKLFVFKSDQEIAWTMNLTAMEVDIKDKIIN